MTSTGLRNRDQSSSSVPGTAVAAAQRPNRSGPATPWGNPQDEVWQNAFLGNTDFWYQYWKRYK